MIGGLVLQHCIDSPKVDSIISFVRKPTPLASSPKLQEVVVCNFNDYSEHSQHFEKADAAYFCLGAYTGQVSDEQLKEITVDFVSAFVKALANGSPGCNFCLLSGAGADRTEKSRISFARYKGMAENYVFKELHNAYTFRPGYIYPVQKRKEPNTAYTILRALYPLIKLLGKSKSVRSTELARAMFLVGLNGNDSQVIENADIVKILNERRH